MTGRTDAKGNELPSAFVINQNRQFIEADTIVAAYKRAGDYGKCETVDVSEFANVDGTTKSDLYRIELYIRLAMDCQDSAYANDRVYKGRPLSFDVTGDVISDMDKLKRYMKKYALAYYNDGDLVTFDDNKLVASNIYQRFTKLEVKKYDETITNPLADHYKTVLGGEFVTEENGSVATEDGAFTKEMGREDFGTYHQLTKDMVLPTFEHLRIESNQKDEQPVPGVLYNQYTIHMCAKREHPTGLGAVGEVIKSKTTHVFYVNQAIAADFEAELNKVLGETEVELVEVDCPDGYPFGEEFASSGSVAADTVTNITSGAFAEGGSSSEGGNTQGGGNTSGGNTQGGGSTDGPGEGIDDPNYGG